MYVLFVYKDNTESKSKKRNFKMSISIHIKFKEYKICLDGKDCQKECNNHILRSINHEMHFQEIKKSTLSIFDDKR